MICALHDLPSFQEGGTLAHAVLRRRALPPLRMRDTSLAPDGFSATFSTLRTICRRQTHVGSTIRRSWLSELPQIMRVTASCKSQLCCAWFPMLSAGSAADGASW